MELFYAYFAGLLTLINPCVLPVLPLVIGSAAQGSARGPLVLAAGMSVSFVALGMFAATVGYSFGLDEARIAQVGAVAMIGFGLILLTPALSDRFELVTAGFATRADAGIDIQDRSRLSGQFLSGALLGAVWSPCVGPVLGGAIALAYQGETLLRAGALMLAFALGTSTIILALAYGTRQAIAARLGLFRRISHWSKPFMGAMLLLVGLIILTGALKTIEGWLLDILPGWLISLSVRF